MSVWGAGGVLGGTSLVHLAGICACETYGAETGGKSMHFKRDRINERRKGVSTAAS